MYESEQSPLEKNVMVNECKVQGKMSGHIKHVWQVKVNVSVCTDKAQSRTHSSVFCQLGGCRIVRIHDECPRGSTHATGVEPSGQLEAVVGGHDPLWMLARAMCSPGGMDPSAITGPHWKGSVEASLWPMMTRVWVYVIMVVHILHIIYTRPHTVGNFGMIRVWVHYVHVIMVIHKTLYWNIREIWVSNRTYQVAIRWLNFIQI